MPTDPATPTGANNSDRRPLPTAEWFDLDQPDHTDDPDRYDDAGQPDDGQDSGALNAGRPGRSPHVPEPAGYLTGYAAAITRLSTRTGLIAAHSNVTGPPAVVLPQVGLLLQTAADLVTLMGRYTRRCDLAHAAFSDPVDWIPCAVDHTDPFLLTDPHRPTRGCIHHLAAAHRAGLGTIDNPELRAQAETIAQHMDTAGGPAVTVITRYNHLINLIIGRLAASTTRTFEAPHKSPPDTAAESG
jgi:hypothetical protein